MTEQPELLPTLGPQVVDWMRRNLVHGPGGVRGKPYEPTLEHQRFIWRAYELWPPGHPKAGRRRYNKTFYSRAKGTAKTEMAAAIAVAEFVGGPVRCMGWEREDDGSIAVDANGLAIPIGIGVLDPDVLFLATTFDQAKDLAYERAKVMISEGPLVDQVDVGKEECFLVSRSGRMWIATSRAKSKDGYIPSHGHGDETHLFTDPESHELVNTVDENLLKRSTPGVPPVCLDGVWLAADADPWFNQTTTAPGLGEGSVAELVHKLAGQIERGEIAYPLQLLYDHVEASDDWDLDDDEQLRKAIMEASGLARDFRDPDGIIARFRDPTKKRGRLRRLWLNQLVKSGEAWLDPRDIEAAAHRARTVRPGTPIVIGFDGSESNDSTGLVGCTIDGHLFVIAVFERPDDAPDDWSVPTAKVDAAVRKAFRDYDVALFYGDPPGWKDYLDRWAADFGEDRVVKYDTRLERRMAGAVDRLQTAFEQRGEITHSGHEALVRHLENARTRAIGSAIEKGLERPPVVLEKPRAGSEQKIDLAIGSVLAKEAHGVAIAKRLFKKRSRRRKRIKAYH